MIPEFQELVSDFLDWHYDPEAPVEAPLIKTEAEDSADSPTSSTSEDYDPEFTSSAPTTSSAFPAVTSSFADQSVRKILKMVKRSLLEEIPEKAVSPKRKPRKCHEFTVEKKETVLSLVAAIKADTKKKEEKLKEEEEEREKYHQDQLNAIMGKVKHEELDEEEEPDEDSEDDEEME